MRITIGLAAMASLCLLAGCNKGAANNSAANAATPAANAAAPAAETAAPVETPAPAPTASAAGGSSEVAECVAGAGGHLPAGTDANAFCTCAVNKASSGTPQNEATQQCAAEMHIQLTGQ
jgi:hypothetical protein